jgi:hypothetical protein
VLICTVKLNIVAQTTLKTDTLTLLLTAQQQYLLQLQRPLPPHPPTPPQHPVLLLLLLLLASQLLHLHLLLLLPHKLLGWSAPLLLPMQLHLLSPSQTGTADPPCCQA